MFSISQSTLFQWHLNIYSCSFSNPGTDIKLAIDKVCPFFHIKNTMTGSAKMVFFLQLIKIKSSSIVLDLHMQKLGIMAEGNLYFICLSVLDGIVYGFLDDPVKVVFHLWLQSRQEARLIFEMNLKFGNPGDLPGEFFQYRHNAIIRQRTGCKVQRIPSYLRDNIF